MPGIRRQECQAGHSPPYSAEVMNEWSCASTHSYIFMPHRGTTLPLLHIYFLVCIPLYLYFLYNYCVTLKHSESSQLL